MSTIADKNRTTYVQKNECVLDSVHSICSTGKEMQIRRHLHGGKPLIFKILNFKILDFENVHTFKLKYYKKFLINCNQSKIVISLPKKFQ